MTSSLSVIIVSYNVECDLKDCLESVFGATFANELHVIVVDNASHDGTVAMVRSSFPQVQLIVNETNVGFPRANNQGLQLARGEYVLYLNPDAIVSKDTLTKCGAFLSTHSDVGLLGCRVLYPDGRVQYECARNFPSLETLLWEALYLHMLLPHHPRFSKNLIGDWDHQTSRNVPCLVGAFMLGRRELLASLGGMDETVFMDLDDVDLCYRVGQAGWRVYYLAETSIVHRTGRSRQHYPSSLVKVGAESKYQFFAKHYGPDAARWCQLILALKGVYRFTLSIPLSVIVYLAPRLAPKLRDAANLKKHWQLVEWTVEKLTRRTVPV